MTRATIELVPAKQMARLYNPLYFDTATFFRDIRTLVNRNELSEVFNIWLPAPDGNGFVAQVQAVQYFNPDSPPDNAHLMRGLSMPPEAVPFRDMTYLEWELNVDVLIDFFQANFGWNDLIKPWYDVWLPESTIEQHVNDVLPTLTPLDVGPFGFLLLFPLHRSGLTRPFFRMPEPDGHPFVWLFDVLTASPPGPTPPTYVADMLARNRRWFEMRARWVARGIRSARSSSVRRIGSSITARCGPSSASASSASIRTTSSRRGWGSSRNKGPLPLATSRRLSQARPEIIVISGSRLARISVLPTIRSYTRAEAGCRLRVGQRLQISRLRHGAVQGVYPVRIEGRSALHNESGWRTSGRRIRRPVTRDSQAWRHRIDGRRRRSRCRRNRKIQHVHWAVLDALEGGDHRRVFRVYDELFLRFREVDIQ